MGRTSGKSAWPPRFDPAPPGSDPRTLKEIEGGDAGKPGPDDTGLVRTCMALHHKPLGTFTVEDLRVMIGQQLGLPTLVPMALARLEEDPLAGGNHYPGDLLKSVTGIEGPFWASHPEVLRRARTIAARALELLDARRRHASDGELAETLRRFLGG